MRTEDDTCMLGDLLGGFLEWDASDESRRGSFMRLRAQVDITRPLIRGKLLGRGAKAPLNVFFNYGGLWNLCYYCGMVNHLLKDCSAKGNGLVSTHKLQYGTKVWHR